jgi:hypothetical protein
MKSKHSILHWGIESIYDISQHLYSSIPYPLSKNGYAFPAWHYYIDLHAVAIYAANVPIHILA